MPILTLTNLHKSFGERVIFDKLNFVIDRGERVGLIGDNGSGKTTLFKCITGEIEPESGDVSVNKSLRVGHLTQDATFDPGNTVIDEAELAFAQLHRLSHELRELEHQMAEVEGAALEKVLREYQDVQHDFELAGGYAWRHKLEATLLGVGLGRESWEQNVETLSGGQRSRLNLAKLLIAEPDVLLLDEPTNHLDLSAIEWLENYLLDFSGAVLLISHDRFLLDRLATRIVWLTRQQLSSYPGNYSAFVTQRAVQELSQQRAYDQQQAFIDKTEEFVRRFKAGQRSKEAKGREKRLNRLKQSDAMIDAVAVSKKIHVHISTDQRAGDRVLDVRGLSKSFDTKALWTSLGFEVRRGERIGIIGPNGSGKTTLLRVLLGEADADEGSIRWGANLNIGYYDQRLDDFDPDRSILEEVADGRTLKEQQLRDALATMLFHGDAVHKSMGLLSGGERARVALVELLLDKPNVILLDEPTNHLDVNSCEALETALAGYAGTILCVSHDRYFLEKVASRLLVIDPPGIRDFGGRYSEWARKQSAEAQQRKTRAESKPRQSQPPKPEAKKPDAKKPAKDNPWLRPFGKLTVHELETQIGETEIAVAGAQEKFADPLVAKDAALAKQLQSEYEQLCKKLEQLEQEYFARGEG